MRLNLGCGQDILPKPDWINIDHVPGPCVDLVLDLRQGKLPYDDASVEEVLASHVLEHLPEWETIVLEAARVLKPYGVLTVRVPYMNFEGQHLRQFNETTMRPFIHYECRSNVLGSGSAGLDAQVMFDLERMEVKRVLWLRRRPFNPIAKSEITWVMRRRAPREPMRWEGGSC